jgi:hypothetical protein
VALDRVQPGEHHRLQFLEAGKRLRVGRATSVMVSPIFASATFLMFATRKPTSPTPSSSTAIGFGEKTPRFSDLVVLALRHQPDLHAGLSTPSITRTTMTTPR